MSLQVHFNDRHGGGALGGVDRIFELDYSDDPWKMSTSTSLVTRAAWPLSLYQPFLYLTCDGCAHCGAGLSRDSSMLLLPGSVLFPFPA